MSTTTTTVIASPRLRRNSFPTTTLPSLRNPAHAPAPWSTAKCHRLLRPLSSKIQALRLVIQTNPSVTTVANEHEKALKRKTQLVRRQRGYEYDGEYFMGSENRGIGVGGVRRKVSRTYSGTSAGIRGRSRTPVPTAGSTVSVTGSGGAENATTSVYDLPFPAAAPQYDPLLPVETSAVTAPRRPPPKEPDANHPLTVLNSLKSALHSAVYPIYLGIYTSLETLLASTAPPAILTFSAPTLQTLAARKIAHCILATVQDVESDDVWYDSVSELGQGGEYLRELTRWHGIEIVREAIVDGLFNTTFNGMGMAGVLVGLCRSSGAEAEAESLLQTMLSLQPLEGTSNHPPLQAIVRFYGNAQRRAWRILAGSLEPASRRSAGRSLMWLGNVEIVRMLGEALEEVEESREAAEFVGGALQLAFGVWGEEYMLTLKELRKEAKKEGRRRAKVKERNDKSTDKLEKITTKKVGEKAEGIVCRMVKKLIKEALLHSRPKAKEILETLVEGVFTQPEDVHFKTEEIWSDWWPENAKLAVLLQGLEMSHESVEKMLDFLSDSIEAALENEGVKEGMKYLASFIAECYCDLYDENGGKKTCRDETRALVSKLLSLSKRDLSSSPSKAALSTPFLQRRKVVTFTPGKPSLDLDPEEQKRQARRWYISQIALHIAMEFSKLDAFKMDEKWIEWVGQVEHQVIGLKIGTPGSVKRIMEEEEEEEEERGGIKEEKKEEGKEEKKVRKGWRWEEGIDAWVAVGGTPGAGPKKKRVGLFLDKVQILSGRRTRSWRGEYEPIETPDSNFSKEQAAYDEEPEPQAPEDSASPLAPIPPSSPPFTLRRSPRSTARIRKSLFNFNIMPPSSSPVFTYRLRSIGTQPRNIISLTSSPPRERTLPSSAPSTVQTTRIRKPGLLSLDMNMDENEVAVAADASSPVQTRKRSRGQDSNVDMAGLAGTWPASGPAKSFSHAPPPVMPSSPPQIPGELPSADLEDLEDELSFAVPEPKVKKRKIMVSSAIAGNVVRETPRRKSIGAELTPREARKIERGARRQKEGPRKRRRG